jgi:uncharacterized membrane protein
VLPHSIEAGPDAARIPPGRSLRDVSPAYLILATFLACAVEAVEALTIVLAVGTTRGWRSPLYGVGAAAVVLAAVTAILGPALTSIPIESLQILIGTLLVLFGLQWLYKAILRAAGVKAKRDEAAAYSREIADAERAAQQPSGKIDWYSFTIAFKGVLLEGLEVVFIVLTFGAAQNRVWLAALAAVAAVVLVVAVGLVVRAPLARVPENALKFAVGILLTSFGIFWAGEGIGAEWPGGDASLPAIIAFLLLGSIALVGIVDMDEEAV